MRIPRSAHYVNHMRNIGYLTGFARHLDKIKKDTWHRKIYGRDWHGVLIQQNNNIEQAIPVHIPSGVPLPADRMPVTVAVHAFGSLNPATGEPTLHLESIDIARPSVRAMPTSMVWTVASNQRFADDDFNPFGEDGQLLKELRNHVEGEEYNEVEEVMQAMLLANRGRLDTRFGANANVMLIAGFLESAAVFIPGPDDYQTNAYWNLLIRQHEDPKRCLPVRLYTQFTKSFKSKLMRCAPYFVAGQIRVKVVPDDEGNVRAGHLYIRTDDIHPANRVYDILSVPDWYAQLRLAMQKEMEERRRAMEAAAKAAVATDSPEDTLFG